MVNTNIIVKALFNRLFSSFSISFFKEFKPFLNWMENLCSVGRFVANKLQPTHKYGQGDDYRSQPYSPGGVVEARPMSGTTAMLNPKLSAILSIPSRSVFLGKRAAMSV